MNWDRYFNEDEEVSLRLQRNTRQIPEEPSRSHIFEQARNVQSEDGINF